MSVPGEPGARPRELRGERHGHGGQSSERATLTEIGAEPADILIIGGGITGAGIARDAAMRGLRTVLVEQGDIGTGTSSHSSRLIHGGLRYLETGDIRLVLEANRERRILLRIAPHLVWPLPFIFPLHRGDRIALWRLAAGMWVYDALALFRNVRLHRMLGKRALLEAEPMLRERGLLGGARFYDAQCDDARLVLATARSAISHGALIANYTAVRALERRRPRDRRRAGGRPHRRANRRAGRRGRQRDGPLDRPGAAPRGSRLGPAAPTHQGSAYRRRSIRVGHREAIIFTSPIDGRVLLHPALGRPLLHRHHRYRQQGAPRPPRGVRGGYRLSAAVRELPIPQCPTERRGYPCDVGGTAAAAGRARARVQAIERAQHRSGTRRDDHRGGREADHVPLDGRGGSGSSHSRAAVPRRTAAQDGGAHRRGAATRRRGRRSGHVPRARPGARPVPPIPSSTSGTMAPNRRVSAISPPVIAA